MSIRLTIQKLCSVSLALLVLFSTVSFTVEKHFCGGTLVDSAVFFGAEKCAMESNDNGITTLKKHCCKDIVEVVEGQDQLKINTFEDIRFEQEVVFFAYFYSYSETLKTLPQLFIPHKNYSPPDLFVDLQIRDAVFLI